MIRLKTLLNLLAYGVALLGFLPLAAHLDGPALLAFPAALALGAWWDRSETFPLKPAFATLFSVAVFVVYTAQISRNHLVEPAINLVVLLLAVRLLSPKRGRDYLQIFALSLFALAASSLLSLGIAYLLYLVPMIVGITSGLVLLSFHKIDPQAVFGRTEARRLAGVCLLLPAASLALMLAFFLILPRTQQPLWHIVQPAAAAGGLSDQVQPGSLAAAAEQRRPAFRVQSPPLPENELYWRGVVLNHIDGHTWQRRAPPRETVRVEGGEPLRQIFFPEPGPDAYLPLFDLPLQLSGVRHRRDADLVFSGSPRDRRLSYEALSRAGGRLLVDGGIDRDFYLQLPPQISPRIEEALSSMVRPQQSDREKIAALEAFFLERRLTYSLETGRAEDDPVDHFLFESRRGYCEHFAAAFALMLRMAEVPARLVGGYYGGTYNAVGGYYLVTEQRAHLWVEALVDGAEWVRLDPTTLARNAGDVLSPAGMNWGRGFFDAVDYFWNRIVIAYDLQQQIELFRQAGETAAAPRHWSAPPLPSIAVAAVAALATLLWLVRRTGGPQGREQRLLRRYLQVVRRRHGLREIPDSTGLLELAERLDDPACRRFAAIFGGALYRDRPLSDEELRRCEEILKEVGKGGRNEG